LKNREEILVDNWPKFSHSHLDMSDVLNNKDVAVSGGSSQFVSYYLTGIKGATWGFMIKPKKEGYYTASFRSTPGSVNVRMICEHFGGGGHNLAAGMKFDDSIKTYKEALGEIKKYLRNNSPIIVD